MRIDNWSLDRVMQLPDWCFGRRWPVGLCAFPQGGNPAWDIGEIALPERCVVWEVIFWHAEPWLVADTFRLALGLQIPTTVAQMSSLDPLLHGVGIQGASPRSIRASAYGDVARFTMKMLVEAASRNLILEVNPSGASNKDLQVVVVVSSVPKEVPDWFLSGQANALL